MRETMKARIDMTGMRAMVDDVCIWMCIILLMSSAFFLILYKLFLSVCTLNRLTCLQPGLYRVPLLYRKSGDNN